nr:Os09g0558250 [Ipomoea trifida]
MLITLIVALICSIEDEETNSYLAKFKKDVAALEAQLKRKSIHVEFLILAPKKSRAIILIALIVALICSIEEEETDSYLAKFKEDVAALEAQLKRKSIHVERLRLMRGSIPMEEEIEARIERPRRGVGGGGGHRSVRFFIDSILFLHWVCVLGDFVEFPRADTCRTTSSQSCPFNLARFRSTHFAS